MKRPDKSDSKYWPNTRDFNHIQYGWDVNEFIDHILDQNKETLEALKESLDCIEYLHELTKVPDNEKAHYAGRVLNTTALIQEAINKLKEQ